MNWSYLSKACFYLFHFPFRHPFVSVFVSSLLLFSYLQKNGLFCFFFISDIKMIFFSLLCISFHFSISSWKFFIFFSKLTSKSSLASWSSLCNSTSHFCLIREKAKYSTGQGLVLTIDPVHIQILISRIFILLQITYLFTSVLCIYEIFASTIQ